MSQFVSDLISSPRFQLAATAIASGATVAGLILGYQAFEQEERLSELKNSIPSLDDNVKVRLTSHRLMTKKKLTRHR